MDENIGENILIAGNLIPKTPPVAYYIPNFITDEEEAEIIKHVKNAPQPKWTQLSHRRLQNWGGIPHPKGMIAEQIPNWLQKYMDKVSSLEIFERKIQPNHVLINEYIPGQGIMGHSDGPLFHPIVTTISCGSHTFLEFTRRLDTSEEERNINPEFAFLLERKSLLILQEELYHNYLHSISERKVDVVSVENIRNLDLCSLKYTDGEILERKTRLSLTIRHVPKTSKLKLKF
ncbi:alpha-ketoglutarate-dependent dioxygenase alkB homolog 6 [Fopius arisanus]|uniref:Alpha-ketoglutarate-dependent dioxygenase alkB homolog 6 n=1 Tax=Fopius arisanus TaxID=64838 RepID=A0A9R1TKV4_9HYME|nr:PREDICTED: alpha-ketoglutarate-dependent dioxygenase alkB homolog 6 [Fopius arisanus]